MLRTMFHAKIHRATVTEANLHYVGSVTVDQDLLDAANILPGELVSIVDITNGARLETYTIAGERNSGVIGINGAAAPLINPGDLVILIDYAQMDDAEARTYEPNIVHVDEHNRIHPGGHSTSTACPNALRSTQKRTSPVGVISPILFSHPSPALSRALAAACDSNVRLFLGFSRPPEISAV